MAGLDYRGNNQYSHEKKRNFKWGIFVAVLFIVVLGIVFFSTFSDQLVGTGKVIDSSNLSDSIHIVTSLSVPELNLKGNYDELILSLGSDSFVYLDNKKVSSSVSNHELILRDFSGTINIKEGDVIDMSGKISEIVLNGVPISSNTNSKIKLSLSPESHYKYFEIKEGFYVKDLSYVTTGDISYEEENIKVNSEKVSLVNYIGSLKIEKGLILLDGNVESLSVVGNLRKITLAR
jgi:hypothetical protein